MSFAFQGRSTSFRVLLVAVPLLMTASVAVGADPSDSERRSQSSAAPDRLGERLCNALQGLPERRKAQCCGASSGGGLAAECARELGRSLRSGAVGLDPGDVDRCTAESARELEGCDWVTPYLPRTPESCRGILQGRLERGAQCRSSLECRDGLRCRGNGPTVPGVCAPPGVRGAACTDAADTLATYARQPEYDPRHPECDGFCLRGRCAALTKLGGACSSDRQCAPGNHCASRRCVEGSPPGLGEACDGSTCDGCARMYRGSVRACEEGGGAVFAAIRMCGHMLVLGRGHAGYLRYEVQRLASRRLCAGGQVTTGHPIFIALRKYGEGGASHEDPMSHDR